MEAARKGVFGDLKCRLWDRFKRARETIKSDECLESRDTDPIRVGHRFQASSIKSSLSGPSLPILPIDGDTIL